MSFKSGFISVVGKPNTGKSTLINYMAGEKISIISPKPQTTRHLIRAIITEDDCQIIFIDTPGMHKPKNKLSEYMVNSAVSSLEGVDIVLYVTEPKDTYEETLMEILKDSRLKVLAVINKCDKYDEKIILETISNLSKDGIFNEIIPVSAITGKNIESLKKVIKKYLPEGPKYFENDEFTDQTEKGLAAELIREKILMVLRDEIPHGIGVEIVSFKERENKNIIDIQANIYCEKKSHKSIIIGKDGSVLKKIGTRAREEIEKMLDSKVFLELWVKVKEDWRNSSEALRTMGYE